jgi:lipopolysaccharide/colanic/teichoic acid biosynthesis glycosyltransferase
VTPAVKLAKRAIDLVASAAGLALTVPLYPLIGAAIWLDSPGPLFFRQKRAGELLGSDGPGRFRFREFQMLKFRTMRPDAEKATGAVLSQQGDPRVTRIGRVLRRTRIDELPQFWNVLTGDMSVVGPRPSPFHENQYCPPWREARLSVRPGITGLWQVRRTRRQGNDFQEWIKYDLEYVEKASWRLDLVILLKTITTMIRKGTRQ